MGISAATLAAYATAASAVVSIYSAVKGSPKPPAAPAVAPPPAEAKAPDADVFKTRNARAGSGPGDTNSTLLTGLGGVPPSALNLGKNTLLGA